jgi:hypothetical protein
LSCGVTQIGEPDARVRDLMDLAGVHTRMQLGWHAARHGRVNL